MQGQSPLSKLSRAISQPWRRQLSFSDFPSGLCHPTLSETSLGFGLLLGTLAKASLHVFWAANRIPIAASRLGGNYFWSSTCELHRRDTGFVIIPSIGLSWMMGIGNEDLLLSKSGRHVTEREKREISKTNPLFCTFMCILISRIHFLLI